jgi:hypothetical protein
MNGAFGPATGNSSGERVATNSATHHGDDGEDVGTDHPDRRDELAALLDDHEEWVAEHRVGTGERDIADDAADLSKAIRKNLEELGHLEG